MNGTLDDQDGQSDASMISHDGNDQSISIKEEVTPKRNAQRTAKVKVKKYGSGEDEGDEDGMILGMESEDNESDYLGSDSEVEKKIQKANSKPKKAPKPKSGLIN